MLKIIVTLICDACGKKHTFEQDPMTDYTIPPGWWQSDNANVVCEQCMQKEISNHPNEVAFG